MDVLLVNPFVNPGSLWKPGKHARTDKETGGHYVSVAQSRWLTRTTMLFHYASSLKYTEIRGNHSHYDSKPITLIRTELEVLQVIL